MKTRISITAVLLFMMSYACAATWTMRTEPAEIAMQWPYQPNNAKITYEMTLKGFSESNASRSLFKTVVYGQDGEEQDTLGLPVAVATGRDSRLAVADMGLKCVHLYIPSEHKYLRLTGTEVEKITSPVSVVFDDDLRLYVSDSATGKVFVFGADGAALQPIVNAGAAPLKRPTGLAFNRKMKLLYVVDTAANRIYAFNAQGEVIFSFGGRGAEQGRFNFPTHIFWSPTGVLYVTDAMNFRIELFDETGGFLSMFGQHGDGFGDLAMPKGVAADRDGIIYVADSLFDNIQLFNNKGDFLLTLGKRGSDIAEFWMPSGIFINDSDTLYVCDTYNHRIHVFRIITNYDNGNF